MPATPGAASLYISWNAPERAGPNDIPTRLSSRVIPSAIPVTCIGTERSITLKPPLMERAKATESIVRPIDTISSVE
jgi:hypothetical protein